MAYLHSGVLFFLLQNIQDIFQIRLDWFTGNLQVILAFSQGAAKDYQKSIILLDHWIYLRWNLCFQINLEDDLTHWCRVTHKCVGNLTIIGPDNGLSPAWRQAIIWTNAGILLIGTLQTYFCELLIKIQTFSLKKIRLQMSSAKCCSFRLGLNVLINPYIGHTSGCVSCFIHSSYTVQLRNEWCGNMIDNRNSLTYQYVCLRLGYLGDNLGMHLCIIRADSRFAPSQWETVLLCNDVSHWLGANLGSALHYTQWRELVLHS